MMKESKSTRAYQIFSFLLLLAMLAIWSQMDTLLPNQQPLAVEPAVVTAGPAVEVPAGPLEIAGVWEQYSMRESGVEFMGRLKLEVRGDYYLVTPLELADGVYPHTTYRSFDHKVDGDRWTFKEEWGSGDVGCFELTRLDNGGFEGRVTRHGQFLFNTLFLRVSD